MTRRRWGKEAKDLSGMSRPNNRRVDKCPDCQPIAGRAFQTVLFPPMVLPQSPHRFWVRTKDRDPELLTLINRHYYRRARRNPKGGFAGPGKSIVLRTPEASAVFVWLRAKPEFRGDGLDCYYCVVFRNESGHLSSEMILGAMQIAVEIWGPPPRDGFITYVDPRMVRSTNPGYCFLKAGWKRIGKSKSGKIMLQASYNTI